MCQLTASQARNADLDRFIGEEHTAAIGIVLDMVPAAISESTLTWCQVPMLAGGGRRWNEVWRTGHIGLAGALRRVDIGDRWCHVSVEQMKMNKFD
jgi:hypothetical protein